MGYYEVKLTLGKILRKLGTLESVISSIARDVKMPRGKVKPVYISTAIEQTVQTLENLGGSRSATEVATVTGRARAVESMHLNELVRNGMAIKGKRGRERVFTLREEYRAEGRADQLSRKKVAR
jgi:DNA-binding transcriptional ArsR family regulator